MALRRVLTDSHIRIEPNFGTWYVNRDPDKHAKRLQEAAQEILEFLKDHRSMDINDVYVENEYGYRCEFCKGMTDKDELRPECCERAIREWATKEELVEFGYEELIVGENND